MKNESEAAVLTSQVQAFGSGTNLARYAFYQKAGPRVGAILSGDSPDSLGGMFLPYVPASGKEVPR
jgi:hypothetical protein